MIVKNIIIIINSYKRLSKIQFTLAPVGIKSAQTKIKLSTVNTPQERIKIYGSN